jgi:hypothetical protein
MLIRWTRENNTTDWTTGIQGLLFQKNRQDHVGIKWSPYETMLFQCSNRLRFWTNHEKWTAWIGFSKMLNLYPMSISQLILFVSFELLSSTDLTLLFALSDGLSFKCACKSSSFCRTWRISLIYWWYSRYARTLDERK